MATHRIPILGFATKPDTSGNIFFEPASVALTNDLYGGYVLAMADSGTKITISGRFMVPKNYVGSPAIVSVWASPNTTANAELVEDFDYRAIASAESADPTTHQESVTATTTSSTTAWNLNYVTMNLTAANLAVDDIVEFLYGRDGAQAADDLAHKVYVFGLYFQYTDS